MNQYTFLQTTGTWMVALVLFFLLIILYHLGHSARKARIARDPGHAKVEIGAANGILLGLLGLLLAFSFSMSNSRYDRRRQLIIEEANDIGTAVLRADLYPDSTRRLLRQEFRHYLEARIAFYESGTDYARAKGEFMKADSLGKRIWDLAVTDARVNNVISRISQMIPALNAMIDITTTRRDAGESTIPDSIMFLLFAIALASSFLIGYDSKEKLDRIIVVGYALIVSVTIYMIIDLDRPRSGLINMNAAHLKITELRSLFISEN